MYHWMSHNSDTDLNLAQFLFVEKLGKILGVIVYKTFNRKTGWLGSVP